MHIVLVFGLNDDGQCGIGRSQGSSTSCPISLVRFPHKVDIVAISAGSRHTLALSSTGQVYSWGWGLLGQLGHGNFMSLNTPSLIDYFQSSDKHIQVSTISAGGMHSGCIDTSGHLYTWGSHSYGQLGVGVLSPDDCCKKYPTVVKVKASEGALLIDDGSAELVKFTRIACGGMHTVAVTDSGEVYCWGRPDSGQTGYSEWNQMAFNGRFPSVTRPKKLLGLDESAMDVAAGGFYTLILAASGRVYAMGKDDFGLLGIPRTPSASMTAGAMKPTAIEYFTRKDIKIKAISAGGWHSCFISADGDLYTCGKGEYGRLGTGNGVSCDEPTKVMHLMKSEMSNSESTCDNKVQAVSVCAGGSHTIWLCDNGGVYLVGRTGDGRLGLDDITPAETKTGVTLARKLQHCSSSPLLVPSFTVSGIACGGANSFVVGTIDDVDADNLK